MSIELAIFEDCSTLVENYVAAGVLNFDSFCHQWKELMFQHMYSAQTSNIELIQTTAAIFHFAKRTVCGRDTSGHLLPPPCNDEHAKEEHLLRRAGAMFLMYAIYFKQPTERFVKIEASPETWREINDFIDTLPSSPGADEVRYVFLELVQNDGFRFTALDYCVGLDMLVDYDNLKNGAADATSLDRDATQQLHHELHEYTSTQRILPALTVLEAGYNEMKEMLLSADTSLNKKSLPPTTIFKSIQDSFRKIEGILEEASAPLSKVVEESESKRRHLKRKGFLYGNKRTTSTAESEDECTDTAKQGSERKEHLFRRMSARTVFTEPLPQNLLEDLTENAESEGNEQDIENEDVQRQLELLLDGSSSNDDQAEVPHKHVDLVEFIDLD